MSDATEKSRKELVWDFIRELDATSPDEYEVLLTRYHADDAVWEIFHPFNTLKGCREAAEKFWKPLAAAIPDMERRLDIFAGDLFEDEYWVSSMGHISGIFEEPWLDIPPTGRIVYLRIGEFYKVRKEKIVETHILLDIPDLMRQAGVYPFRTMLASSGMQPGPKLHNGIRFGDDDPTQETLETVLNMHKALHDFDGKDINSMKHDSCWSEHFNYYAPAGIGTTRGMGQFKKFHQQPFLASFPDRYGRDHYCRISDGPIAATTHWTTLTATHTGSTWLGLPATMKKLTMRVADWYCADDAGKLHENWLFMDIPHICLQMGYDIFENLRLQLSDNS